MKKAGKQTGQTGTQSIWAAVYRLCACTLLLLATQHLSVAQQQAIQLDYHILQGGKKIGWLKINKQVTAGRKTILLTSEVKTRKIISICVLNKDSAAFENSTLEFASQYRSMNGNVSLNKLTSRAGAAYMVTQGGKQKMLHHGKIGFNLLSLYTQEPIGIKAVYCETDERFADITRTKDGGYKVTFKNGDSNCYFYDKGICTRVVVKHTFYSAEIILTK